MAIEPIGGAERKEKEDVMDDVIGSGSGERATGTPNTIYDLSSVLFHALEGGASYDTYIEDAEREGDEELAEFFRRVRDEDSTRADEAQRLLAERTSTASMEGSTSPTMGGTEGAATSIAGGAAVDASSRTEGTLPLEPGTSGDLPGTEPRREEDASTARTEEVPRAEEVPSGTPPQAPPGDVQSETSPEPPSRTEDASPPDREREERGLLDRAMDALRGRDEEPRREESERRESREDEPPTRR